MFAIAAGPGERTSGALPPEALKPSTGNAGVVHSHRGISMPKKILKHAEIGPSVSQSVTTAMPQHVRVDVPKPNLLPCGGDQVADTMPGERRPRSDTNSQAIRHRGLPKVCGWPGAHHRLLDARRTAILRPRKLLKGLSPLGGVFDSADALPWSVKFPSRMYDAMLSTPLGEHHILDGGG
jgi:hypothetical protein